jgi:hypothetical protein
VDVAFASFPVFGDAFSRPTQAEQDQFQAYWLDRLNLVGEVAVPAIVGRFLVAGRLFSTSFKVLPGAMKIDPLFIPFTLSAETPGILHLTADLAFYKGWDAYKALADANSKARQWLSQVDRQTLINALGAQAYDLLTKGGTQTTLFAEVEMPPAWLTDP